MNINSENIASCRQTHSTNVRYINSPGVYENTDGLLASYSSNLFLQINTADCVPIFLHDEVEGIIGIIHSGWKGTCNEIILNAIDTCLDNGSKPSNIKILLGPSIKH